MHGFDVATTGIASMYLWRYTREFKRFVDFVSFDVLFANVHLRPLKITSLFTKVSTFVLCQRNTSELQGPSARLIYEGLGYFILLTGELR